MQKGRTGGGSVFQAAEEISIQQLRPPCIGFLLSVQQILCDHMFRRRMEKAGFLITVVNASDN